ncbi:McrB family protein [Helicobacter felistomachi]|uniref:McrB family protein n=1 Tax=Helicobacter felistomachi TaxID=3040201 RepID=UPI0025740AB1|nr:AAA family ATPase [Helicobacter sp. NHP21005]
MEKLEWSAEQRGQFTDLFGEFVDLVDVTVANSTMQTPKAPRRACHALQDRLNAFLKAWGYVCVMSPGFGNLANEPAIAFFRQDTLQEWFSSPKSATPKKGFYIWFTYARKAQPKVFTIYIAHAFETEQECQKCPAYQKLFAKGGTALYAHVKQDLNTFREKIADHFLELATRFNTIVPTDFRPTDPLSTGIAQDLKHLTPFKIPLNQILYGPPGTGKTYNTINQALEILEHDISTMERTEAKALFDSYKQEGRIGFVTFHQSFSYEEFVEGIRPEMDSDQVAYQIEDGIFKQMCKRASKDSHRPYILIIDEINRGNISKIFGELITLIEASKRIGREEELKVTLPYSQKPFGVPDNLYILGTMNTADRSIALLDTALRRRFSFVEMLPDSSLLNADCAGVNLRQLLEAMNARIEFLLDQNHTIGHSYFLGLKDLESLQDCFKNKIIPLLQEYFYDDHAKVNAVLNDNTMLLSKTMHGFKKENEALVNTDIARSLKDFVDSDKKVYQIKPGPWQVAMFEKIYNDQVELKNEEDKESIEDNNMSTESSAPTPNP